LRVRKFAAIFRAFTWRALLEIKSAIAPIRTAAKSTEQPSALTAYSPLQTLFIFRELIDDSEIDPEDNSCPNFADAEPRSCRRRKRALIARSVPRCASRQFQHCPRAPPPTLGGRRCSSPVISGAKVFSSGIQRGSLGGLRGGEPESPRNARRVHEYANAAREEAHDVPIRKFGGRGEGSFVRKSRGGSDRVPIARESQASTTIDIDAGGPLLPVYIRDSVFLLRGHRPRERASVEASVRTKTRNGGGRCFRAAKAARA